MQLIEQRDRMIAGAAFVMLAIGMPIAYLSDDPEAGALIVVGAIDLALLAAMFLWLFPRERATGDGDRASRTALILGIVAFLTGIFFWTGVPLVLGAAAVALGLSAPAAPGAGRSGMATAGIVLGGIAALSTFLFLLFG